MRQASTVIAGGAHGVSSGLTVGLDLGDRRSHFAVVDAQGAVVERGVVATTREALLARFTELPASRVVLEVSTHSRWVSALCAQQGHTVVVANARELKAISGNPRKSDRIDAELLARLGRVDPELLRPLVHRGEEAQRDLTVLRARDALVRARTKLINAARGLVKATGERLPTCSAASFHERAWQAMPRALRAALHPVLESIAELTRQIREYDRQVAAMVERYPAARLLLQVSGVGPITTLAFMLTIDDPGRFTRSRMVPAYVGLVPKRRQSGERDPELHITKTGDALVRRLLVQCAHRILGPFGQDSELRRWGLRLAGVPSAGASRTQQSSIRKRRAVVALARKLAVVLHHLWVSGEVYAPLRAA